MTTAGYPESVVIVGGGTAGWMAANLFLHHWPTSTITLVESNEIGVIGVGEGSTPYLKTFFEKLGIADREWMPACHATYKAGIRFLNWSDIRGYSDYFHPFYSQLDLDMGSEFFQQCKLNFQGDNNQVHPDDFFIAGKIAKLGLAPIANRALPFTVDYGYHFDACLLGQYLKKRAVTHGLVHIVDTVSEVVQAGNGTISYLMTKDHGTLPGKFFVDCSGFTGVLVNKSLGLPYVSYTESLFNDAAVTVASKNPNDTIPAETTSTALAAGWAWKIPLTHRFGNGYVYSSQHLSSERAQAELAQHLNISTHEEKMFRHIKMRIGRLEKHWYKNCLAVGLSQGFFEPLEATALMLTQFTLDKFFEKFLPYVPPEHNAQPSVNASINIMMEGVRDYIQAHYLLNTRTDTDYWKSCRHEAKISDRLGYLVNAWDEGRLDEALTNLAGKLAYLRPSWYVIFSGMGRVQAPGQAPVAVNGIREKARAYCEKIARDTFTDHVTVLNRYATLSQA